MTHAHPTPPLPEFSRGRVLVVGDVMLDRYWHGSTSRVSPEAPVPIVHVKGTEDRAGGAGNVALNIAALGGRATVIGFVGRDEAGQRLAELLERGGTEALLETLDGAQTITKLRVISQHQQLIRLDFEDGPLEAGGHGQALRQRVAQALPGAGVLVLSDYAKGTLADPQSLIAAAREQAVPVIVDPKRPDFAAYHGATVVTPNLLEFQAAVGPCVGESELFERAARLIERLDLGALLLTRGEHGMTLLRREAAPLHLPAHAREVFDVTGAGDTVVGLLAAAVAAGQELDQAARLANIGAGLVVGKVGTATVSRAELEAELTTKPSVAHGVVSEEALLALASDARTRGETLVMTNGCFDILHPGHVAYLEQAARLGDRLIVAVNDDASVKRLKGEGRPVNGLAHRMAVLAGLRSVDWVVPFAEDTPRRLICRVRPDLLVKGGDYRPEEIAGADCVREKGGEVLVIATVPGHSTTGVIDRLRPRRED